MPLGSHEDTIVAPITALGGAVAVVRLSGDRSWEIAASVFRGAPFVARHAGYGMFRHGDDGLALPFTAESSYTGEESIEMSVHGSAASVRALVDACVSAGARPAEPGEFTLRAFMNGKMDLTQAEGVRDTVLAATESQLRQANMLREGKLRDEVSAIRSELIGVLAAVEASTDFSEEIGEIDKEAALHRCSEAWARVFELKQTARAARIVRHGVSIAIVGLPNAGKSSLLNAVLGSDRAIVTDVPGTTRDTVEERIDLGGTPARLIDTAGLRDTSDAVEALGVSRSRSAIANADLVWYVFDASAGWTDSDEELYGQVERPSLIVANKTDLHSSDRGIPVSALQSKGISALLSATSDRIEPGDDGALVNSRHVPLLEETLEAIERAMVTLSNPLPSDLVAVDCQAAVRFLGEITGETTPPDVIDRIFHDFCIGK